MALFQKGQSGNPAGRPKGSGKLQKAVQKQIRIAAQLSLGMDAKRLLHENAPAITSEIIEIALAPPQEVVTIAKKNGKEVREVRLVHSQAKVKCLLACFERIVPALKVVEVKDGDGPRRADEMTDGEILEMMERMVRLAERGGLNQLKEPEGEGDGPGYTQ